MKLLFFKVEAEMRACGFASSFICVPVNLFFKQLVGGAAGRQGGSRSGGVIFFFISSSEDFSTPMGG